MAKKIIIHKCGDCPFYYIYNDRFSDAHTRCKRLKKSVNPFSIDPDCSLGDGI